MITIRSAHLEDSAEIAHVNVKTWQSAYRGMMSDAYLDSRSESKTYEARIKWFSKKTDTDYAFVAVKEQDGVIGYVIGGKNRANIPSILGEIGAIYILPPYQHQGIGRRLMHAASARLAELSLFPYLLWVLEKNNARGFYEHLGGIFVQKKEEQKGAESLQEVAYKFDNVIAEKI